MGMLFSSSVNSSRQTYIDGQKLQLGKQEPVNLIEQTVVITGLLLIFSNNILVKFVYCRGTVTSSFSCREVGSTHEALLHI